MDKNIATLLREDTRTVDVVFQSITSPSGWNDNKPYKYVTTTSMPLACGDVVVVPTRDKLTIGMVCGVHDDLLIDTGADTEYKYVVCKVDSTRYAADMAKNAEIVQQLQKEHKARMREQFRQQCLANNAVLTKLLG